MIVFIQLVIEFVQQYRRIGRESRGTLTLAGAANSLVPEQRRQTLSDLVAQRGFVSLTDLSSLMEVSESTVRRDLDFLHEAGVLRRTHGGAIALADRGVILPALEDRSQRQAEEKRQIAAAMAVW